VVEIINALYGELNAYLEMASSHGDDESRAAQAPASLEETSFQQKEQAVEHLKNLLDPSNVDVMTLDGAHERVLREGTLGDIVNRYIARNRDFRIGDEGVLEKYSGQSPIVIVPNGIVAIGDGAFKYNQDLVFVHLSEGVTQIEWSAFAHCSKLVSVRLPDSSE